MSSASCCSSCGCVCLSLYFCILCIAPRASGAIFSLMFIFNCYFRTLEIVWVVVLRERDVYTHTHTMVGAGRRGASQNNIQLLITVQPCHQQSLVLPQIASSEEQFSSQRCNAEVACWTHLCRVFQAERAGLYF